MKCKPIKASDTGCKQGFQSTEKFVVVGAFNAFEFENGRLKGVAKLKTGGLIVIDHLDIPDREKKVVGLFEALKYPDNISAIAQCPKSVLLMECGLLSTAIELARTPEHTKFWDEIKRKYCIK